MFSRTQTLVCMVVLFALNGCTLHWDTVRYADKRPNPLPVPTVFQPAPMATVAVPNEECAAPSDPMGRPCVSRQPWR